MHSWPAAAAPSMAVSLHINNQISTLNIMHLVWCTILAEKEKCRFNHVMIFVDFSVLTHLPPCAVRPQADRDGIYVRQVSASENIF